VDENGDLHDVAVLAVDDLEDNLDLIEEYLEHEVWSILRAQSGNDAIDLATEHNPDVVLLDLMMPGVNGLAVLRTIRSIEGLKDIGVILQTAYADKDNIVTARRMGCEHFLCKPLTKERLLAEMRTCLKDRPLRRNRERNGAEEPPNRPPPKDKSAVLDNARQLVETGNLVEVTGDSATIDTLRNLISDDGEIGQRLIKVANSTSYGGRYRARTVSAAIIRIGMTTAKDLIRKASVTMRGGLSSNQAAEALELLDNLARRFPDRTATTEGTLALLEELRGTSEPENLIAASDAPAAPANEH